MIFDRFKRNKLYKEWQRGSGNTLPRHERVQIKIAAFRNQPNKYNELTKDIFKSPEFNAFDKYVRATIFKESTPLIKADPKTELQINQEKMKAAGLISQADLPTSSPKSNGKTFEQYKQEIQDLESQIKTLQGENQKLKDHNADQGNRIVQHIEEKIKLQDNVETQRQEIELLKVKATESQGDASLKNRIKQLEADLTYKNNSIKTYLEQIQELQKETPDQTQLILERDNAITELEFSKQREAHQKDTIKTLNDNLAKQGDEFAELQNKFYELEHNTITAEYEIENFKKDLTGVPIESILEYLTSWEGENASERLHKFDSSTFNDYLTDQDIYKLETASKNIKNLGGQFYAAYQDGTSDFMSRYRNAGNQSHLDLQGQNIDQYAQSLATLLDDIVKSKRGY